MADENDIQAADPALISRIETLMRPPPFSSTGNLISDFPWYYERRFSFPNNIITGRDGIDGAIKGRSFIQEDFWEAGYLTKHFGLKEYAPGNFKELIDDVDITQVDLESVQQKMIERLFKDSDNPEGVGAGNVRMMLQVMDNLGNTNERDDPANKAYLTAVFEAVGVDKAVIDSGDWKQIRKEFTSHLPGGVERNALANASGLGNPSGD